ncbi:MAG: hypothetical protein JWN20_2251 [Jatrophihabitantaceae bacterium]|nr:hypothetical protein [Jatrophihabitantaceae bacterium]
MLSAACNGGSGSGPTRGVESSATTAAATVSSSLAPTYPNARPGEKPPARPVDILSDAGAEAFARYFMQTVDWAYASMDSSLMRAAYDPASCNYCNQAANRTDADKAAGKRYEGGRSTISLIDANDIANPLDCLVLAIFTAEPVAVYDKAGVQLSSEPAETDIRFNLRISFGRKWNVQEVKQLVTK